MPLTPQRQTASTACCSNKNRLVIKKIDSRIITPTKSLVPIAIFLVATAKFYAVLNIIAVTKRFFPSWGTESLMHCFFQGFGLRIIYLRLFKKRTACLKEREWRPLKKTPVLVELSGKVLPNWLMTKLCANSWTCCRRGTAYSPCRHETAAYSDKRLSCRLSTESTCLALNRANFTFDRTFKKGRGPPLYQIAFLRVLLFFCA